MSDIFLERPGEGEYAEFYAGYVSLIPAGNLLEFLERQRADFGGIFGRAAGRADHRYAPGKWSVREVVNHVIDAERVFGYRALAFARGETQPLPKFDEEAYARTADVSGVPLADLAAQFDHLRRSHVLFLRSLTPEAWRRTGTASGKTISVRALACVMGGHAQHHVNILRDRYGLA